ncbi:baseplate J/gp47 family protein [Salmonella enterica]|nr:baseplate J/gp47 family protein [Salmonella enterica]
MSYKTPTLAALIAQSQQDIAQHLRGTQPRIRKTALNALSYGQAGLAAGEHEHLNWVARQIVPSTADEDNLLDACNYYGVKRKVATPAQGTLPVAFQGAATIPAGTRWQRDDGVQYASLVDATQTAAGVVDVALKAVNAGNDGNAPAGTTLTLVTPVAGVSSQAKTTEALTGGADTEPLNELLARLEYRVQYPPGGGTRWDYVRWARECAGVTRAWCLPTLDGPGTVGVTFVMDALADIFPTQADVARVQDYIAGHDDPVTNEPVGQPLGPVVTVFASTRQPVPVTIKIAPRTDENKKQVTEAINNLFYREACPEETLIPSQFWRAVASVKTLTDFEIIAPAAPVSAGKRSLLVPGVITWA